MHAARLMRARRRRPFRLHLLVFAACLAFEAASRVAHGQTPTAPPPIDAPAPARAMTMAEALTFAHEHQPSIRAALSRVSARAAQAKIPTGQWLPTVGVTAQLFAMTANNTTATYVQPAFMDLPRIGATQATTSGNLSPYASTLVGAGVLQEVFDFG